MSKQFDSDTAALRKRLQTNVAGATYDLESWIIEQVSPRAGMRVLDLGCGTGKQSFAVAGQVGPAGQVLGVDISAEAVRDLNERAARERCPHVRAVRASLDDVLELLREERFDLVLSAYAIYYASDMSGLLAGVRSLLRSAGQAFVCGPGRGTNEEILQIIAPLMEQAGQRPSSIEDFLCAQDIERIGQHYERTEIVRLPNRVRFDSAAAVLQWWENHNSFVPAIRDPVHQALQAQFAARGSFVLTKNVLGIHFYAG